MIPTILQVHPQPFMPNKKEPIDSGVRVRNTPPFKLKDKHGRNFQGLKLSDFGFIPEVLIIEKVPRSNNTIVIRAVLTEEEVKKENKRLAKLEVKN